MNRMQMLEWVQSLCFVVVDMQLYLDTHPCDEEALAYYKVSVENYKEAKKKYEEMCGPLNHMHVGEGGYRWLDDPWPWEYAKNKEV